jgi:serine phosphatase RsbU (regulator of sigma subunit)/tetratricopeptide (TPR) repeat protein
MKKFLIIIFLSLQIILQANNTDSLKSLLNQSAGKDRIDVLVELMQILARDKPNQSVAYGKEALDLLKKHSAKKTEAQVFYLMGWAYGMLNKPDSAKIFADLTGKISKEAGFTKGLVLESFLRSRICRNEGLYDDALKYLNEAKRINDYEDDLQYKIKILNELGSVYRRISRLDEALDYHEQALNLLKKFNDEDELTTTYVYLGIINDIKGNYDKALSYHQQALELNKKQNDIRGIAGAIHNIGILYQKLEKYPQALDYYKQALKYWEQLNNQSGLASTYNSLGGVNELTGNPAEALKYYKLALGIWEKTGSKNSVSIAVHNIGSVYEALGKYEEAIKYIQQAIDLREELGDISGVGGSWILLASVYNKQGKTDLAIITAKKGLELAKQSGAWSSIRHAHLILSEIYESNGFFKEALSEYKNYKAVHDSVFNSETQQSLTELQEKYNSEDQKKQIELLKKENEINNLYRTLLIGGLVLVLLILILLYNRYRLKIKAHETQQKLHQIEIESYNLKAEAAETRAAIIQVEFEQKKKELDAARELQLSMLPAVLPKHNKVSIAALMLTATEVGGDYYDFHESEDGSLTIAIGDATGHGAQAGIMVTATKSLFNLLADEKNIADILRSSNLAIKKMRFTNIFMAFAILRLKGNILELAGAGMPPAYIYRAETKTVASVALKGLPLGSVSDYEYPKTSVKLNSGDVVTIVSDGFPELFNSKKESIGFDKIPGLLKVIGDKSPEEIIASFKNSAEEWLNGSRQDDDMTFVVFKVK